MKKGSKMTIEQKEHLRIAHLGQIPWNKGQKGFRHSGSFKKGHGDLVPDSSRIEAGKKLTDEKHPSWKGDGVGYFALHSWIRRKLGKPTKCDACGIVEYNQRKINWANISGKYFRRFSDWKPLCKKCHCVFDKHPFLLPRTIDERKKMSERTRGIRNPFYGKKHSKETLEKIRLTKLLNFHG